MFNILKVECALVFILFLFSFS